MMASDMPRIERRSLLIYGGYGVAFALVAVANFAAVPAMARFVVAVAALATGAVAVGESVERLSQRLSPAATGVVQSVLGNLPELFLAIFALQAGLAGVVVAALVGSVLGNALFVLGLASLIGGLRHGKLTFSAANNRLYATELLLGVAALTVPFLATQPGAPDFGHSVELSGVVAIVLLVVFAVSVPISIRLATEAPAAKPHVPDDDEAHPDVPKPLFQTLALLVISGASSAVVADWFVEALQPAMASLGMSESFAGLIVVALASNAIENLAGVTSAAKGRGDLSMSLILNAALQVVLFVTPVVVLLSYLVAPVPLTLIISPLLLGTLAVSVLLVVFIVSDGEANAFEGAMLLGLYAIIAAAVWWGPPIGT